MKCLRSLALFVLFTASASVASAQMPGMPGGTRPVRIMVSGGLTVPAGGLGDLHDTGLHYDAALLVNIAGFPLTIRPELSISRLKLKDVVGQTSYSGDDVTQMFSAMGNLEFPLAGGLYVLAGGGILSMSLADAATAASGDVSASKFAFDAGAGFRFRLGGASGFVEAKMGSASYEQGKFGFSSAQFIPITFGLIF